MRQPRLAAARKAVERAPVRISDSGRSNSNPLRWYTRIDFPLCDMRCRVRTSDKSVKPWRNRSKLFERRMYCFSSLVDPHSCRYFPRHIRGCSLLRDRFPSFRTNGKCTCLCNFCSPSNHCRMCYLDRSGESRESHRWYDFHCIGFGVMVLQMSRIPDWMEASRSS